AHRLPVVVPAIVQDETGAALVAAEVPHVVAMIDAVLIRRAVTVLPLGHGAVAAVQLAIRATWAGGGGVGRAAAARCRSIERTAVALLARIHDAVSAAPVRRAIGVALVARAVVAVVAAL